MKKNILFNILFNEINFKYCNKIKFLFSIKLRIGDWGLGIGGLGCGGWGGGVGHWAVGDRPNPQPPIPKSPIPNPQSPILYDFYIQSN